MTLYSLTRTSRCVGCGNCWDFYPVIFAILPRQNQWLFTEEEMLEHGEGLALVQRKCFLDAFVWEEVTE